MKSIVAFGRGFPGFLFVIGFLSLCLCKIGPVFVTDEEKNPMTKETRETATKATIDFSSSIYRCQGT